MFGASHCICDVGCNRYEKKSWDDRSSKDVKKCQSIGDAPTTMSQLGADGWSSHFVECGVKQRQPYAEQHAASLN
jgi:hypothetical protein